MANVPVIISRAIITREGASPILPGASEDPALPVNPDGPDGVSTFIALTDTPNDYTGQGGKVGKLTTRQAVQVMLTKLNYH
jgi:hypothetical protein